MKEWRNEGMNEWRNEWMHDLKDGWMDMVGWVDLGATFCLLSCFFTERPLPQLLINTSSLSIHLHGLLLLWAASQLAHASSSAGSETQVFSSRINRGSKDPTAPAPEATLPPKWRGFTPDNVFPREFTRSRIVILLLLPTMLLTWWCWHEDDMMLRLPLDIRL